MFALKSLLLEASSQTAKAQSVLLCNYTVSILSVGTLLSAGTLSGVGASSVISVMVLKSSKRLSELLVLICLRFFPLLWFVAVKVNYTSAVNSECF